MGEQRRELARTSIEVEGRTYGLIVYETSFDQWDDPEGYFTERCALYGPDRAMPEPGWEERLVFGLGGEADIIGRTRDGGGRQRKWEEQSRVKEAERQREEAERQAKITPETPRVEHLRHECGHEGDPEEFEVRAYECSRCGQTLLGEDGRRCPDCNIFTAKLADRSCPSCEQAIEEGDELETVVGVEVDGHFVSEEEIKDASV